MEWTEHQQYENKSNVKKGNSAILPFSSRMSSPERAIHAKKTKRKPSSSLQKKQRENEPCTRPLDIFLLYYTKFIIKGIQRTIIWEAAACVGPFSVLLETLEKGAEREASLSESQAPPRTWMNCARESSKRVRGSALGSAGLRGGRMIWCWF